MPTPVVPNGHAPSIWMRPGEGSLRCECQCGWIGPKRATGEVALADHLAHLEAVQA